MPSPKHRTSSKSGASPKSTTKPAKSRPEANTSATATRSFAEIFGAAESPEIANLRERLEAAKNRLTALESAPKPKLALHRTRHMGDLSRHRRLIRDIEEAITALGNN